MKKSQLPEPTEAERVEQIKAWLLDRRKKCDEEITAALKKYDCHFEVRPTDTEGPRIAVINNL